MIYQTKLTDLLIPNKFKNCIYKIINGSALKLFIDTFFWDILYILDGLLKGYVVPSINDLPIFLHTQPRETY